MKKKKAQHFLYGFLCLIAIVMVIFAYSASHGNPLNSNALHIVGEYSTDGFHWTEIHNADELTRVKAETILIKGHYTEDIKKGELVWAQFHRAIAKILRDDKVVFTNEKSIDRTNMPFITEWSCCSFDGISTDNEITVIINGKNSGLSAARFLKSVCKGDKLDLLRFNLQMNFWQICIAILMICIGTSLALTVFALCFTKNKIKKSYVFSGLFLISGGICTLIDYNYITLLIPNNYLINTMDYLSQCFICEFLMLYITAFLENKILKRTSLIISLVMAADIVAYFILPFRMRQYVDAQIPVFVSCIVLSVVFLIYEYFKLHNKKTKPLLVSGAVVSVFIVVEMINYYITSEYWIVVFQFGLLVYACMQFYFLIKQANEMIQEAHNAEITKRKLTEARINIMLSQIQPHFLYNALGVIQHLCHGKAPEAEEATIEFSEFLRGNLDSIRAEKPIAFEKELNHVKNYLALEKKRFDDMLNIEYDIKTTLFRIPALTLQPIVENAVRYGITKKTCGGTVRISAEETERLIIVTVSDDGMGFDINQIKEDGRSHIGIDNVRNRLEAMCGGKLEITSKLNFGTVATITLNKEGALK